MKKYFLILILIACKKEDLQPPPQPPCEDKFTLMIDFDLYDQENISHIEVETGTEIKPHSNGTAISGEPGSDYTYTQPFQIADHNTLTSKMVIWRFKVFAVDGSYFYTKYDTLIKQ